MDFASFMSAALYEPGLGYYSGKPPRIGRSGDFFTSVSVGPLFGQLLARRFLREWHESGTPKHWRIIECGAHDGTLAADILAEIATLDPAAFSTLEYAIPEPLAPLRHAQQQKLQPFASRIRLITNPHELASMPLPGIAFGNEVLDALPCRLVQWQNKQWLEKRVSYNHTNRLVFLLEEIHDADLLAALEPLGRDFPEGYGTEVRTGYRSFLAPLVAALGSGLMIWVDYGFPRADYYHPGRTEGTLRTFSGHRAGTDVLECPGGVDITAHVDFTAVVEAAESLGWRQASLQHQGRWLAGIAREWLLDMEGNPRPEALRQFQTLTHPAHLGSRFLALELSSKAPGGPDSPAS